MTTITWDSDEDDKQYKLQVQREKKIKITKSKTQPPLQQQPPQPPSSPPQQQPERKRVSLASIIKSHLQPTKEIKKHDKGDPIWNKSKRARGVRVIPMKTAKQPEQAKDLDIWDLNYGFGLSDEDVV
jgi:hypothetical protein